MVQTSRLGQFVLSKDNMDINVISPDAHQVIQQKENTSQKSHNFDPLCECVMCPIRQKKRWEGVQKYSGEGLMVQLLRSIPLSDCKHTSHSQVY